MVCSVCEEGKMGKLHGGGPVTGRTLLSEGQLNLRSNHPVSEEAWVLLTEGWGAQLEAGGICGWQRLNRVPSKAIGRVRQVVPNCCGHPEASIALKAQGEKEGQPSLYISGGCPKNKRYAIDKT